MSDPTRMSDEERAKAALREQGDAVNRVDPVWSPEYGEDVYLTAQPKEPVVPRERLFSRKVLFGWAFAALLFVFAIRVIVPVIIESVKEAVITSVKASAGIADAPPLPRPPAPGAVPATPAPSAAPVLAPSSGTNPATTPKLETKSRR